MVQQGNFKLSYANALKQNINHKPPTNNTIDRTSERPTLQQQLQSFSAKLTKRNRSRSPSREQSTTKSNYQPRDQEIAKPKAEIEKLKQINQTGKGAFTYYVITEEVRGASKMLMHNYGGGGRRLAI